MIHSQMEKVVSLLPTAASTSTTSLVVDTLGWDYASFAVLRASNAATTFATVLRVEESDDNVSYVSTSGFTGGTDFSIPAVSDTSSTAAVKLDVDTKAKRRYLRVSVQPSVSVPVAITGRLSRGLEAPTNASESGVVGWVRG